MSIAAPPERFLRLLLLSVFPLLHGCVVVSMHSFHSVEVCVRYRDTGKPVTRASVKVHYRDPIGYGVYYVLRIPKDVSSRTDEHGIAILQMADYERGGIDLDINGKSFGVDRDMVVQGGTARGDRKMFPTPPRPKPGETPPQYLNAELRSWYDPKSIDPNTVWLKPIIIRSLFEVRLRPLAP
jgi:hypothetical protein